MIIDPVAGAISRTLICLRQTAMSSHSVKDKQRPLSSLVSTVITSRPSRYQRRTVRYDTPAAAAALRFETPTFNALQNAY